MYIGSRLTLVYKVPWGLDHVQFPSDESFIQVEYSCGNWYHNLKLEFVYSQVLSIDVHRTITFWAEMQCRLWAT